MMYGHYLQVSQEYLHKILNDRELQEFLVYKDASKFPYGEYFCVSVYWYIIDFLLTSLESKNPYEFSQLKELVNGGIFFDDIENTWFDFGPMRYFLPDQVKIISRQLCKITPEKLIDNYHDLELMDEQDIYPYASWQQQDRTYMTDELKYYYSHLVIFFKKLLHKIDMLLLILIQVEY